MSFYKGHIVPSDKDRESKLISQQLHWIGHCMRKLIIQHGEGLYGYELDWYDRAFKDGLKDWNGMIDSMPKPKPDKEDSKPEPVSSSLQAKDKPKKKSKGLFLE